MISYCGCDPGLQGAFAVVSGDRITYKLVMPTLSFTTKNGKTKREIDSEGVLSFLSRIPVHTHVVIEEQRAFRSQNITASCTLCKNYGKLLMALTAAHMYLTEVTADVWQAHFGIVSVKKGEGDTKEQAYEIVQHLYPNTDFRKSERAFKPHDGIVDAVLIATYCQALFESSPELTEPLEVRTHEEESRTG